jgi:uncharacterized Fe-S cluster-containing radical SAM superfamily protein
MNDPYGLKAAIGILVPIATAVAYGKLKKKYKKYKKKKHYGGTKNGTNFYRG